MEIVLDEKRSAKKSKSPLQKRFDKLRSALDRERRRSERFRRDLDGLVDIYQSRSRENDRRAFDDLVALSERLIVFASRKTLSNWHRGELLMWIRDLNERRIAPIDPKMAERLQREYNEAVARAMGMSVEEMLADAEAAMSAGDFGEHSDAEFDGCFDGDGAEQGRAETPGDAGESGACEEDSRQADMFGFDDIAEESAEAEQAHWSAGEEDNEDDEDRNELSRKVMDGSWAKKLFRRAAQMLHPDREPDPRRRESKQARLLSVNGVGPETADDILLYAFERPAFVIDAYTRRLLLKLGLIEGGESYAVLRQLFMQSLKPDVAHFKQYHALIVRHAKQKCADREDCPHCLVETL